MRDPLERVSVRVKLAVMFVSLCLLAFGVGGWIVLHSAKEYLEREIRARMKMHSRALAAALDSEVRTLQSRTQDFASDGYIRSLFARVVDGGSGRGDLEPRTELTRHLRENKLPIVPAFLHLALADPDGRILIHTQESLAPGDVRAALDGRGREGLWKSALAASPGAFPSFAISTPLRSIDGRAELGRLMSWVHPGIWACTALHEAGFHEDLAGGIVEISIQDQSGQILDLPAALIRESALGADSETVRSGAGLRLSAESAPNPRSSRHPIARSGWSAIVFRSAAKDLSALGGLQSRFVAVGGGLLLLSSLLLFFPMRFLALPLSRLQEAATRLREGDYSVRVDVESRDEIGSLATAFNHMAAAVEERTQRLEGAASDLRSQRAELRRESARLQAVISSMNDGLLVIDQQGAPVVQNPAGRPLLALLDQSRTQVRSHHPCREESPANDCAACLFDPEGPPRACRIDVGPSVFEVRSTPLAPTGTERCGRVLVARDITERVAVEERQIHQERLAVLGEVASVMAHELNNPLAAISMFAQLMEGEIPEDSPHRESLSIIRRNTETCKRAIRELLDYATDTSPESLPVDVHAVIEDVARFLRPIHARAGIGLAIRAEASNSVVVGDEVQLRQIFVNLLVNAFQAMAGRSGEVVVTTRNRGARLEVEVADQGCGIPDESRGMIFKPFYTTKPRGEGTGLGLPTSRRIAEVHGGGLELVETGPGGSIFRVKLRVRPQERQV